MQEIKNPVFKTSIQGSRDDLLSPRGLPSALEGLTSVFGMGTGVTLPAESREL